MNLEDSKIIEMFFQRKDTAIEKLSEKYGSLLLKVANNILNNPLDSEECVNDTYLGVWNTIPPQNPNPLLSYVLKITRNLAIAKYHKNTAKKRNSIYDVSLSELENCFESKDTAESEFDAKQTAQIIDRFLLSIDKESRVMFVRRYYFSDSISSIAKRCLTSPHNVSVKLSRIREKLKNHLIKEGVFL